MVYLAKYRYKRIWIGDIAENFNMSQNHISKIVQRLVKADLVDSKRGPNGGFLLKKPLENVTLKEIIETIDGPINRHHCFFADSVCRKKEKKQCDLGKNITTMLEKIVEYLESTTLDKVKV